MNLHTEEVLEKIDALGTVLAWQILASSNVVLTASTRPSWWALASEVADLIAAGASVETRHGIAVIDVSLTELPSEALSALARKAIVFVDAGLGTLRVAWVTQTLVNFSFALESFKQDRGKLINMTLTLKSRRKDNY